MQVNEVSGKVNEVLAPQAQFLRQDNQRAGVKNAKERAPTGGTDEQKGWPAEEVKGIVDALQESLNRLNERIVFSIHKETGEVVVKVVDPKTNKVIKQIPPEELLKLREKLDELIGILFEARA